MNKEEFIRKSKEYGNPDEFTEKQIEIVEEAQKKGIQIDYEMFLINVSRKYPPYPACPYKKS